MTSAIGKRKKKLIAAALKYQNLSKLIESIRASTDDEFMHDFGHLFGDDEGMDKKLEMIAMMMSNAPPSSAPRPFDQCTKMNRAWFSKNSPRN